MEAGSQNKKMNCLVCTSSNSDFYIKKNNSHIFKCVKCKTLFVYPIPKDENIEEVYEKEYFSGAEQGFGYVDYDSDKSAMKDMFIQYIKDFKHYKSDMKSIFDIGAATGYFLDLAKDEGLVVSGVEISDYATNIAINKGIDVKRGTIENVKIKKSAFDVVTMWDVIEHMKDPRIGLKKVNEVLKSNGLIAISTPDSGSMFSKIMSRKWHSFVPPEHLYYFNKKSLSILLKENGFEILKIKTINKRFTLKYIFRMLYRWQKLKIWESIYEYIVSNKFLNKITIFLPLGDNMYIVAKKIK